MEDQPIFDERLLPETNELYRKNFNNNAKYQEVIWKALCELEDYIEIYGNESWHSKKAKYFPHIPSYLLFPDKNHLLNSLLTKFTRHCTPVMQLIIVKTFRVSTTNG